MYHVFLTNAQGAHFSAIFSTKKECQEYLDSFADPHNLSGTVHKLANGTILAVKNRTRFSWY